MQLIDKEITLGELEKMSDRMYNRLVKAVVDVQKGIMVVDADLHSDEEEFLLSQDCEQHNLWGINLHPQHFGTEEFVEFDSMINIRPVIGNGSRDVEDPETRTKIIAIVMMLVKL